MNWLKVKKWIKFYVIELCIDILLLYRGKKDFSLHTVHKLPLGSFQTVDKVQGLLWTFHHKEPKKSISQDFKALFCYTIDIKYRRCDTYDDAE